MPSFYPFTALADLSGVPNGRNYGAYPEAKAPALCPEPEQILVLDDGARGSDGPLFCRAVSPECVIFLCYLFRVFRSY